MDAFLAFIARGRVQAVVAAALFLLVPPASFVSGAIVGLVTLRYGLSHGAFVLAASVAAAVPLAWLLYGDPFAVLVYAIPTGVPVLLLAAVLRLTHSQGITLMAAGAGAGLFTIGVHLVAGDSVQWWGALLGRIVLEKLQTAQPPVDAEILESYIAVVEVLLAPVMTVTFMVWAVVILFLARWAHARMDNPGGFGREFRELRFDRRMAMGAVVLALLAVFAAHWAGGLAPMLLQIALVLYAIQGLAVAHGLAAERSAGGWLTAIYLGLLFLPLVMVPLAVAGFSDTWMDYRRRFARGSS